MPHGPLDFDSTYRRSTYRGTIRFLDIVEPYMPDRVVRQFGRVQSRPLDPIEPRITHRGMGGRGKGHIVQLTFDDSWDGWDDLDQHVCAYILGSPEAIPEWEVEKGYIEWFTRVSHPYVSPHATVHPPPPAHPPTAMDLTRV